MNDQKPGERRPSIEQEMIKRHGKKQPGDKDPKESE